MVSRKNPSIRKQASFPFQKYPLTFLLQCARVSHLHVTSPSTALSDCRVQGQVPVVPAHEYRGSGSVPAPAVLEAIPALFTWAWLEFPECPSPMTAGTEDREHMGPRAFQAWPLHITRDQPKITACLVMLQDKLRLGCHGFCCCSPLSIPGVVTSIPWCLPIPAHSPCPTLSFANLTLPARSFCPLKLGSPRSCGSSRCCPAPCPPDSNCWWQGWGEAAGQPQARVAFWGGQREALSARNSLDKCWAWELPSKEKPDVAVTLA